jgi:hypothetical protein
MDQMKDNPEYEGLPTTAKEAIDREWAENRRSMSEEKLSLRYHPAYGMGYKEGTAAMFNQYAELMAELESAIPRQYIINEPSPDTITLKRIYSTHCQVCGKKHLPIAIVYYVHYDGNLACLACAEDSGLEYEPRIYKEGK